MMDLSCHIWKRQCPHYPNSSVIVVSASDEFAQGATGSSVGIYEQRILKTVQRMPGYSGMVYLTIKRVSKFHADTMRA